MTNSLTIQTTLELNSRLMFYQIANDETPLLEAVEEILKAAEYERDLDSKMGCPGQLTPKEWRMFEHDVNLCKKILDTQIQRC